MCYTVYVLGANLGWFRGETNFGTQNKSSEKNHEITCYLCFLESIKSPGFSFCVTKINLIIS